MDKESEVFPFTGEVLELDVGLSTVGVETGVLGIQLQSLGVEIKGELELVFEEGFLRPLLKIQCHGRHELQARAKERRKGREANGTAKGRCGEELTKVRSLKVRARGKAEEFVRTFRFQEASAKRPILRS